jgi:hypothetical protein
VVVLYEGSSCLKKVELKLVMVMKGRGGVIVELKRFT